ncbi:MAG: N-acetylmuramoyl-L-alanine amidase [Novosphingobium sp.]|nr:N-acetylmuramoyl-L-alanine amidase [Novosphingobium sp.]
MQEDVVHRTVASPNWDERKLPITMVVLHYTEMPSAEEALARMCDPEAKVSAHYLISEAGEVTQLVDDAKRAWHAGVSYWRGERDINSASIGIELDHPGHKYGYRPFARPQMEALVLLLAHLVKRHDIPRANVLGHSDIAPARKIDPGELFEWNLLARYGLALPTPKPRIALIYENQASFFLALERFGYDITDGRAAVRAFQRRWRPQLIDGEVDAHIGGLLFELLLDRDLGNAR